jgi:2-phosphosulfolactate phosphatase
MEIHHLNIREVLFEGKTLGAHYYQWHQVITHGLWSVVQKVLFTGSFPNLSAVCDYLVARKMPVVLGCAAWKDRVNIEDTLFAGAVISRIKQHFEINCDSSNLAETMYNDAKEDMFGFMKAKNASHYHRLSKYGLEKDVRYCLTPDCANILCVYEGGKLVKANPL